MTHESDEMVAMREALAAMSDGAPFKSRYARRSQGLKLAAAKQRAALARRDRINEVVRNAVKKYGQELYAQDASAIELAAQVFAIEMVTADDSKDRLAAAKALATIEMQMDSEESKTLQTIINNEQTMLHRDHHARIMMTAVTIKNMPGDQKALISILPRNMLPMVMTKEGAMRAVELLTSDQQLVEMAEKLVIGEDQHELDSTLGVEFSTPPFEGDDNTVMGES